MWKPISWIINLVRRERRRLLSRLKPLAITVVEDLFDRDFNGDGSISDARTELRKLILEMRVEIRDRIFDEYWNPNGVVRTDVVAMLPVRVLKKVLAIALLVRRLESKGWPIPLDLILKYGYSILDSALQEAYESSTTR